MKPKITGWHTVVEMKPPPGGEYLVRRDRYLYTAKVCYGMHLPWWVVQTMNAFPNHEAEPAVMQDTDQWQQTASEI